MQIVPSLLFGISASLDSLLIGITFCIRGSQIKLWQNVLISTITLLGTCLSVGLGTQLTLLCSAELWGLLGNLILILFGTYYIIKFMIEMLKKYHSQKQLIAAQTQSGHEESTTAMTLAEVFTLGCALSANNIGIGLSASIAGLSLLPAATVTFFFSFIFLWLGNRLSSFHTIPMTENAANLLSGVLLIGLGVFGLLNVAP